MPKIAILRPYIVVFDLKTETLAFQWFPELKTTTYSHDLSAFCHYPKIGFQVLYKIRTAYCYALTPFAVPSNFAATQCIFNPVVMLLSEGFIIAITGQFT
jgi:hypothetical protein